MFGKWLFAVLAPLALAAGLTACNDQGVQPGVVNTSAAGGYRGEAGRVVAIRDVSLSGGSGLNQGTAVGGGLGVAGGAVAGAAISGTVGGALLGAALGGVGGAIAGTAIDNSGSHGIEVTVQKDDGTTVTIAQKDQGDIQMGDRIIIVYDRNGVARAVRDTGRRQD